MSEPTALIAEDEPLMRERLKEKLAEVWPELVVVAEAEDGAQALALFDEFEPQIAFLDIRMPGRNGLDVAASIGEGIERAREAIASGAAKKKLDAFVAVTQKLGAGNG